MSDIWCIRAVPRDIRQTVTAAAKRERKTVGEWLIEAIEAKIGDAESARTKASGAAAVAPGPAERPTVYATTPGFVQPQPTAAAAYAPSYDAIFARLTELDDRMMAMESKLHRHIVSFIASQADPLGNDPLEPRRLGRPGRRSSAEV